MLHNPILHASIVLLSFFTVGSAIKCFQCNSVENSGCENLSVNDTNSYYFKECSGDYGEASPFCRKVVTEITEVENSLRIFRGCGWIHAENKKREDSCRNADTDFIKKKQCECFSDACNASSRLRSSLTTAVALVIGFSALRQLDVI